MDDENRMTDIRVGDRIKFRVVVRDGLKTATRLVTGFYLGDPEVRFWGHRGFCVRRSEVIEIMPATRG